MLETRLLPPRPKDIAQVVKADLLGHVELDQDKDRALQCFV